MFRSHLILALRGLRKHPLYTSINVVGLAVALTACAFLVLYVLDEFSYDDFHVKANRTMRVVENQIVEGQVLRLATSAAPLAPALEKDFAGVEHAVRVLPYGLLVSVDPATKYQEDQVLFVDSTFFDVFSFPFIRGDATSALLAPFSIVLTESTARKYFGSANPVGQTLRGRADEDTHDFSVTGVVDDPPHNTLFRFDMLASFASMRTIYGSYIDHPENWEHPPLYTFAALNDGIDVENLRAALPDFALRNMGERRTQTRSLHVERLADIRLHSNREAELTPGTSITYVYVFSLAAFFILLIASINFMNLATARAARRAGEVGLRKALGAGRGQLARQFIGESILIAGIASLLAIVLVEALLPAFNLVSGKSLNSEGLRNWRMLLAIAGAIVLVGTTAGAYPALYMSRFRPAVVLKGRVTTPGTAASVLQRGLVVFQFVVAITLMIGTAAVVRQLDYMRSERLGFDKQHVLLVPLRDQEDQLDHALLKESWSQLPRVNAVSASSGMPGLSEGIYDTVVEHVGSVEDSLILFALTVDHDYAEAYALEVVAGRDFSQAFASDEKDAFVLNESAARRLGWAAEEAIGKQLAINVWFQGEVRKEGEVIGVVKDFQYHSLHRVIEPMILHIFPNTWYYDYLSVRVQPDDLAGTLAALEDSWSRFNPDRPFEYTFLDDQFDDLYRAEARLGSLVAIFAGLAMFVACMGLFGLATFSVERRTKEVGVRKVLGASVSGIVVLLSRELLKLTAVAFVVSAPLAYAATQGWLSGFAYRVDLSWWSFISAGLLALTIAFATVSFHAVKSARRDPVLSLRHE